jgi:L-asparaginase
VADQRLRARSNGIAPTLSSDLPALEFQNFALINSFEMTIDLAHELVKHLALLLARTDVRGAVVTHGTDTMEETSFLTDLLLPRGKPVVFTGAQLPQDDPQADGPRNLEDSIRVAASPQASGLGVVICFNRQLHAARDVTKTHTSALETFQSSEHGALGCVDAGEIILFRRPAIALQLAADKLDKKVDLIRLSLGMDATLIDASREKGRRRDCR